MDGTVREPADWIRIFVRPEAEVLITCFKTGLDGAAAAGLYPVAAVVCQPVLLRERSLKKIMVTAAVIVVSFAAGEPALARHGARPKHGLTHYHRAHEYRVQPYAVPHFTPGVLDRRDPSRPGGLDPSFHPTPN